MSPLSKGGCGHRGDLSHIVAETIVAEDQSNLHTHVHHVLRRLGGTGGRRPAQEDLSQLSLSTGEGLLLQEEKPGFRRETPEAYTSPKSGQSEPHF